MTITLPEHHLKTMREQLQHILLRKQVSKRTFLKLLGTLCSSAPSLYGARNLFSTLQFTLTEAASNRIQLTPLTKAIKDWVILANTAAQHAVPIHTVVPHPPHVVGTTDASKEGMGGCWTFITNNSSSPIHALWRAPFPPEIKAALVSADQKNGTITNSDLELAALIQGSALIAAHSTFPHVNITLVSDNTPAVTWINKESTTSNGPAAYLLHQLAQHRRKQPYTLSTLYVPGSTNTIADCCLCLFTLSDTAFLAKMNVEFPVQPSWTLVLTPPNLMLSMIYALSKKLCTLDSM